MTRWTQGKKKKKEGFFNIIKKTLNLQVDLDCNPPQKPMETPAYDPSGCQSHKTVELESSLNVLGHCSHPKPAIVCSCHEAFSLH